MFRSLPLRAKVFFVATLCLGLHQAPADTYTYDTDNTAVGVITEGTIGWNTTNTVWNNGSGIFAWQNGLTDVAVFGGGTAGGGAGTAGAITVGSVLANGITFNTTHAGTYSLTGGTITLVGSSPTLTANVAAAISSVLDGTNGMTKNGAGNLTLSGGTGNLLTGLTTVSAGTLTLHKTSGNALNDDLTITGGNVTWNAANQLADAADVIVSGGTISFNNFSEQLGSYTQTSGGLSGGNGGTIRVTGAFSISGGNQYVVNSGGSLTVGSLSLTGGNGMLVGGNNTAGLVTVTVGAGGLNISNQTITLNHATTTNAKGDKLILQGDITSAGTSTIRADVTTAPIAGAVTQVELGNNRIINVTAGSLIFDNSITVVGTGTTVKTGAGTLSLSLTPGTNGVSVGNLRIEAGTLNIADSEQLDDTTNIINAGGQLSVAGGMTETIASYTQTSGTGLLVNATGRMIVTGTTAISGTGVVGTGALTVGSGGLFSTQTLDLRGYLTAPAVVVGGANTSGVVTNLAIGSGGLLLSGQNITFNAATAGQAGSEITLTGNVTASGANTLAFNADALLLSGVTGRINMGATSRTWTINDNTTTVNLPIAGAAGLIKEGAGTLTFGGANANTYTGDTLINGGTIRLLKTAGRDALAGNVFINNGGSLLWSTSNQIADSKDITLVAGGFMNLQGQSEVFNNFTKTGGAITSTGGNITILGLMNITGGGSNVGNASETGFRYTINSGGVTTANTTSFVGSGTDAMLIGGNTSNRITRFIAGSGGVTLQNNTISLNRGPVQADPLIITQGSEFVLQGTLTASGTNNFNQNSDLLGVSNLNLNGGTRTFNITGGTTTVNLEVVSNNLEATVALTTATATAGGIEKTGAGTLVLSRVNTYTGNTTINGGTFRLASTGSIDASARITVAPDAIYNVASVAGYSVKGGQTLEGGGSVVGATTIASAAVLSVGTVGGDTTQTLSFSAGLNLSTGSTTRLDLVAPSFTSLDHFNNNPVGSPGYNAYIASHGNDVGGDHDRVQVTGTLNQATGALIVVYPTTFAPVSGQIYNLFDWSVAFNASGNLGALQRNGAADSDTDLDLPDISATGLMWDISHFATSGVIVVVPEPGRAMLLIVGTLICVFSRRRRLW